MRDKYKNKKPSSQLDKKKDSIKSEVAKEKVNVPNNWDRYEEDEDLQNVQMEATNFKTLSSNINESEYSCNFYQICTPFSFSCVFLNLIFSCL